MPTSRYKRRKWAGVILGWGRAKPLRRKFSLVKEMFAFANICMHCSDHMNIILRWLNEVAKRGLPDILGFRFKTWRVKWWNVQGIIKFINHRNFLRNVKTSDYDLPGTRMRTSLGEFWSWLIQTPEYGRNVYNTYVIQLEWPNLWEVLLWAVVLLGALTVNVAIFLFYSFGSQFESSQIEKQLPRSVQGP